MPILGIILLWLGYSVSYFGYDQITGGNNSFSSLIIPGKYAPVARDNAGGSSAGAGTGAKNGTPVTSGNVLQVPITDTSNGLSIGAPAGNAPNPNFSTPITRMPPPA